MTSETGKQGTLAGPAAADADFEAHIRNLPDADEVIDAIRHGRVDALVVRAPHGEQVYTITGADRPYRLMIEQMQEGAVTLAADGIILYGNRRLAEMLRVPLESVVGESLERFCAPDHCEALQAFVAAGLQGSARRELDMIAADGTKLPVFAAASGLDAEGERVLCAVLTDLTEHRVQERLRASEERLRLALSAGRMGTWDWDIPAGRVLWSEGQFALLGLRPGEVEPSYDAWLGSVHPDDRARVAQELDQSRANRAEWFCEYRCVHPDGAARWVEARGRYEYAHDGAAVRMYGVMVDIHERKQAEEHQLMLLGELGHRVKNTLASVQSMAEESLRGSPSMEAFAESFRGRLRALADAHGLLTKGDWSRAELTQVVDSVLRPYHGSGRIKKGGPPIELDARQALAVSMVLHELGTNAAKHGAFSVASGSVAVEWDLHHHDTEGECVRLSWVEQDGPPVREPSRKGFGMSLISDGLSYELGGETSIDFHPSGLRCTFIFPLGRSSI